jgi:hypothetical protein
VVVKVVVIVSVVIVVSVLVVVLVTWWVVVMMSVLCIGDGGVGDDGVVGTLISTVPAFK